MQLTIFTPTYNRENYLKILYNSLINQTNKSFQWIIVDDGSKDNTLNLIKKFQKENKIIIKYFKQSNSGKHIAHNKGVELCDTELFFCVDSDDYILKDTVEIILNTWNKINLKSKYIGIVALKGYSNGKVMGNEMPSGIYKSTLSELYNLYGKKGETALVFQTKFLKQNSFPKFNEEKFLSEEVVYNKLDRIAPLVILNKIIYIAEYLDTGLTKNYIKMWKNSPKGVIYLLNSRYIQLRNIKTPKTIYKSIRVILILNAFCINRKLSILKNSPNKVLSTILIIPSIAISLIKFN